MVFTICGRVLVADDSIVSNDFSTTVTAGPSLAFASASAAVARAGVATFDFLVLRYSENKDVRITFAVPGASWPGCPDLVLVRCCSNSVCQHTHFDGVSTSQTMRRFAAPS